uniref:Uncharacterized protein n=1 Tax=viral metagenome TaxID=1070528 RepID=A0A6C0HH26_9ZZZZ
MYIGNLFILLVCIQHTIYSVCHYCIFINRHHTIFLRKNIVLLYTIVI